MARQVALSAVLVLAANYAAAGQFKTARYAKAGVPRPYRLVAAELTSSGNVDLIVVDYGGHVSVLLGNGDGTFQSPLSFPIGAPIDVAVGDLNEDGRPDLVVVESPGGTDGVLHIFFGEGDGKFHAGPSYQVGVAPISVAIADFNGDGHLDVAVANSNHFKKHGSVMVFSGNGKGKLAKDATYVVAGSPWSVAAGDLNGDKFPDLAVTQETAATVAVLLNDGTGKFLPPVSYSVVGSGAVDVKMGDLRKNGDQDLVVANLSQGMVLLLNNGDGTFGKPAIYRPCGNNCLPPEACTVADFNRDGHLDVACATNRNDSYLFYGNGQGNFGAAIPIKDTINFNGGYSIAAGDFNNDKAPDLAIPIELKGKVAILLNTKQGAGPGFHTR
jgi:hypothetical protein